jgi:mono/diheme cytochrome c family protein
MIANGKWALAAAGILAMAAVPATDSGVQALPDGVTEAMVEEGATLFASTALCFTCHGPTGDGVPNLGPPLTDETWLNIEDPTSYDVFVELINTGVPMPKEHMIPMVPRAGSGIDDDQVRAVAAFVWTLANGS